MITGKQKNKKSNQSKRGKLYIGTSGWSYEHWQDIFYPEKLAKKNRFDFFTSRFSTVELNATFYRLFPEKTFEKWAIQAPNKFLYAVKLSRWITHLKRLKDIQNDLQTFLTRASLLEKHLGPILIQLPPSMHRNDELLHQFLDRLNDTQKALKKKFRVTVEFRHPSWLNDEIYEILTENNIALCLADMPKIEFPRRLTSNFTYIRFHGRPLLYQSLYPDKILNQWADWLAAQIYDGKDVFAYFNNDYQAHAVQNARQLQQLLDRKTTAI